MGLWRSLFVRLVITLGSVTTITEAADACTFPGNSSVAATFNTSFTCSVGNPAGGDSIETTVNSNSGQPKSATNGAPNLYSDVRSQVYDMSPEASFTNARSVKVATIPRTGSNATEIGTLLQAAAEAGAKVALLTEEDFTAGKGLGEKIDGPMVTAVAAAAKTNSIAVVCPFRLLADNGQSFNAAVVIGADGVLVKATFTEATHYEKVYPVLGWPVRPPAEGGFATQLGEVPIVPGLGGVQVWDLQGVGRIAVLTCFDINFAEVWHEAYGLGARVVFWPSMMRTPDRDAISYARLYRFNIVANGKPMGDNVGQVLDTTGHPPPDTHINPSTGVVTATLNLDLAWLHENGPGALICPGLKQVCAKYPGAYAFGVDGCGGEAENPGCAGAVVSPGETTVSNNAVFLIQAANGSNTVKTPNPLVTEALAEFGMVSYRDYIMANRQGLNSLRQTAAAIPPAA